MIFHDFGYFLDSTLKLINVVPHCLGKPVQCWILQHASLSNRIRQLLSRASIVGLVKIEHLETRRSEKHVNTRAET